MNFFSIMQLVLSIILLLCVATFGIAHLILGTISFFGFIVVCTIAMIMVELVKLSYKEYVEEKEK
jgi:hypothetical protein